MQKIMTELLAEIAIEKFSNNSVEFDQLRLDINLQSPNSELSG
jgi:hypothetical protein